MIAAFVWRLVGDSLVLGDLPLVVPFAEHFTMTATMIVLLKIIQIIQVARVCVVKVAAQRIAHTQNAQI